MRRGDRTYIVSELVEVCAEVGDIVRSVSFLVRDLGLEMRDTAPRLWLSRVRNTFLASSPLVRIACGLALLQAGVWTSEQRSDLLTFVGLAIVLVGGAMLCHATFLPVPFSESVDTALRDQLGVGPKFSGFFRGGLGTLRILRQCVILVRPDGADVVTRKTSLHIEWDNVDCVKGKLNGPLRSQLFFGARAGSGVGRLASKIFVLKNVFHFMPKEQAEVGNLIAAIPATVKSETRDGQYNWCLAVARWLITLETAGWVLLASWTFLFYPSSRAGLAFFFSVTAIFATAAVWTALRFRRLTIWRYITTYILCACGLLMGLLFLSGARGNLLDRSISIAAFGVNLAILATLAFADHAMPVVPFGAKPQPE